MLLLWADHTAPAVDIILLVAQVIFQPGRERKVAEEHWASQAQAAEMLSYPQPTKVLQAPHIS